VPYPANTPRRVDDPRLARTARVKMTLSKKICALRALESYESGHATLRWEGPVKTHEDYLTQCAPEARARLEAIRAEAERLVPGAERTIAYKMPALRKGRVFVYFAAFKNHIGIYPPVTAPASLVEELSRWRGPKGNLAFPLNEPLPLDIIGRVVEALAAQYAR
jgi:uncharacterized protein YdhG (YjbR/CyaY superfamily)